MTTQTYRDLVVWDLAMSVATDVYALTRTWPADERFGLVSQVRRAAASVPSNIAEGHGRHAPAEFRQFLGIARGSLREVETQIELAVRLNYADPQDAKPLLDRCAGLAIKLTRFITTIQGGGRSAKP